MFPNRPRPLFLESAMELFPTVYGLDPSLGRSVRHLESVSKSELESIMGVAGKCHAVVCGYWRAEISGCFPRISGGHSWNYVKESTESGEDQFVILDSYSKRHHHKGVTNPEHYLASYEDAFDVILFFDKENFFKVDVRAREIFNSSLTKHELK